MATTSGKDSPRAKGSNKNSVVRGEGPQKKASKKALVLLKKVFEEKKEEPPLHPLLGLVNDMTKRKDKISFLGSLESSLQCPLKIQDVSSFTF